MTKPEPDQSQKLLATTWLYVDFVTESYSCISLFAVGSCMFSLFVLCFHGCLSLLSAQKEKNLRDLWSLLKGWCVTLYTVCLLSLFLSLSFQVFFLKIFSFCLSLPLSASSISHSFPLSLSLPLHLLCPSLFSSHFPYTGSLSLSLSISLGTIFFS